MTRLFAMFVSLVLTLGSASAQIDDAALDSLFASDEPTFLPVDEAFQFDFVQQGDALTLKWRVEEGYYLYKHQFKTVVKNAQLSDPVFLEATPHEDEFMGKTEVYYGAAQIDYTVQYAEQDGVVKISYQGCAEAGLCYPPTIKVVYLNSVEGSGSPQPSDASQASSAASAPVSEQFELASLLQENLPLALLTLFGAGLLLAFTPCVYPMYPIISAIVVGGNKDKPVSQTLTLSFVYVQGMALTYSLLGLLVASVGVQFQIALQHPIILSVFIGIFVLLALVMFGAWELQLPSSWQEKLNAASNKQKGGQLVGVFVMGAISGLVASPCTTAPLTAVLLVVAQSNDLVTGFIALYALSVGMGLPLMAFAVTGGKLLPKAGNWMNVVKTIFGFMLLSVALFFLERMYVSLWVELAWALLGLALFTYLWVINQATAVSFYKGVRTLVLFVGLFASAMYGYQALQPHTTSAQQAGQTTEQHLEFALVRDLADFEQKLEQATAQGKSVMIDLYADWCVACKEFEAYTFPDPAVQQALQNTVLLQIDLTDNTPTNINFMQHFDVLGLPTIMFFDREGTELNKARVTGFVAAKPFAEHLNRIFEQ